MKLEDLGYNSFFEEGKNRLGLGEFPVARIISQSRESYIVKDAEGEYLARITGAWMHEASSQEDYPAVGDWVAILKADEKHAVIHGLLPRLTLISRRHGDRSKMDAGSKDQIIAANIDVAFVVESVDRDYSLNRFERYIALIRDGGAVPAIILNKTDLLSREALDAATSQLQKRFPDTDIILASAARGTGLEELERFMAPGKTYCFLGSSGVGKSSLINALLGADAIETKGISSYSGRGRHTTTRRQMYFLDNGSIVIDNPGVREVGIAGAGKGINAHFRSIGELAQACKFDDCTHTSEPGCAVLRAVQNGELGEEEYANYVHLKKEAEHYDLDDAGKREKDRQFGKFLKKMKKGLKDMGHKQY